MKAIVQDRYGSAGVLHARDIAMPEVGADEALVRIHAASVHLGDWIVMTGSPFVMRFATGLRTPRNPVPGTDVAGTVEAVGADVTTLRPGDEVFGWCSGAFAEFASAPEANFIRKPANLTFAFLIALVLTIILDVDSPRAGFVRVSPESLIRLQQSPTPTVPATPAAP